MGDQVIAGDGEFELPDERSRIVEERMAHDRAYFEEHPDEVEFVRPMVDDEFWPVHIVGTTHVIVRSLGPGLRTREPIERRASTERE